MQTRILISPECDEIGLEYTDRNTVRVMQYIRGEITDVKELVLTAERLMHSVVGKHEISLYIRHDDNYLVTVKYPEQEEYVVFFSDNLDSVEAKIAELLAEFLLA